MYSNDSPELASRQLTSKHLTEVYEEKAERLEARRRIAAARAELRERAAVQDRREMLRVKLKSLAAEARFIRREEQRTWGELRTELHAHRTLQVRIEARHTHIAYGLIRGRTLDEIEPTSLSRHCIDWTRVRVMIRRYGPMNFVEPACMPPMSEAQQRYILRAAARVAA